MTTTRILVVTAAALLALAAAGTAAADVTRSSGTNEHLYTGPYIEVGVGEPVYQTSHDWIIVTHPGGSTTYVGSATFVAEPSMASITGHWAYTIRATDPWSVDGLWWVSANGANTVVDAGRYVHEFAGKPYDLGAGRWDAFPFTSASYAALVCSFRGLVPKDPCGG